MSEVCVIVFKTYENVITIHNCISYAARNYLFVCPTHIFYGHTTAWINITFGNILNIKLNETVYKM